MVIGVAGVVVTTLSLGFAGSWVFLYPLPFHSVGEWNELATGLFAASVLLVGVSILTWCCSVLAAVLAPSAHERGGSLGARLGATLGFGYVSPRFATTKGPVPYAVIPLTVIAIDMIIATLPLRRAAHRDDRAGDRPLDRHRPAARQGRPLVVRPPGRVPAPVPRRRGAVPPRAALRGASARRRAPDRPRVADRRGRERDHRRAPHVPGLPERLGAAADQHDDAAADVRDRDAVGALAVQPVRHDLGLEGALDGPDAVPLRRDVLVARRRDSRA